MKEEAKDFIKSVIWSLPRYRGNELKKPICLYATRRGGSTMLMQIIGANRGVRYYDEPFSVFTASCSQLRFQPSLPIRYASQFTSVVKDEEDELKAYFSEIISGSLACNNPWRFWRSEYDFVYRRVLLKILEAKPLIDWIDKNFNVDTVCFFRHPIPTAMSVIRRGWGNTSRAYLTDGQFCDRYLSPSLLKTCWQVYENGTPLMKGVLNWCLDNTVPLTLIHDRPNWIMLTYEGLVTKPNETIERIAQALNLSDNKKMLRIMRRPSNTAKQLPVGSYRSDDRAALVHNWEKAVDNETREEVDELLGAFGIDLYTAGSAMPHALELY